MEVTFLTNRDEERIVADKLLFTEQSLTEEQQSQVRTNIGAVGAGELSSALPNPHKLTFTGAVNAEYNGSEAVEVEIPAGGAEWKLVANVTLAEDVEQVSINTNLDGKTFAEAGYSELFIRYKLLGHGSSNYSSRYSNLQIWFNNAWHGGTNAGFTNLGNGYDDATGSVHAIYPKELESTGIGRVGHARHSNEVLSYFQTYGVLASVNIKTTAGLKAGSQIIIYGR